MPSTAPESSILSVSHKIYHTHFPRKGRTRVHPFQLPFDAYSTLTPLLL
jgi:hypothetical protein